MNMQSNTYALKIGKYTSIPVKNKSVAIDLAETLLSHFKDFSLMRELNDMQAQIDLHMNSTKVDITPFSDKYTIPDYFINLVLAKFDMKIEPVFAE